MNLSDFSFVLCQQDTHHKIVLGRYSVSPHTLSDSKTLLFFSIVSDISSQSSGRVYINYLDLHGDLLSQNSVKFFFGAEKRDIALLIDPPSAIFESIQIVFYFDRETSAKILISKLRIQCMDLVLTLEKDNHINQSFLDTRLTWSQSKNDLILNTFLGSFFVHIPFEWSIDLIPSEVFRIAEFLLLSPIFRHLGLQYPSPTTLGANYTTNPPLPGNQRALLSFSFGEDSTAAASILPENTIKLYCKRPYSRYFLPNGASVNVNPYLAYDLVSSRIDSLITVPNNLEMIGLKAGMRHGFRHGFGYGAIGVILASLLKCDTVAFGSVLEQVYLKSGTSFTDIHRISSSHFNQMVRLFAIAGLKFSLPCGGLSETITSRICEVGPLVNCSFSCPNINDRGEACGRCFKCFRKERLKLSSLHLVQPDQSVTKILLKRPLKSATSLIYACKAANDYQYIQDYINLDVSFVERYYDEGMRQLMPDYLYKVCTTKLAEMGISPMSHSDVYQMKNIGKILDPDSFSMTRSGLT